jgi:hypothetical protein
MNRMRIPEPMPQPAYRLAGSPPAPGAMLHPYGAREDTLLRMTFLQAAEAVLRTAKKPLAADEITAIALRRGLTQSRGKTPAATMSAALYRAPADSPIRREFTPGRRRAMRDSVRWTYDMRSK